MTISLQPHIIHSSAAVAATFRQSATAQITLPIAISNYTQTSGELLPFVQAVAAGTITDDRSALFVAVAASPAIDSTQPIVRAADSDLPPAVTATTPVSDARFTALASLSSWPFHHALSASARDPNTPQHDHAPISSVR